MDIFESLENLQVSKECFDDIMDIVEEIISEVSVKRWKEAAINSLARRGFEAGKMDADVNEVIKKKKWSDKKLDKHFNANDRISHAKEVAHLPSSKMSANKVLGAARKVFQPRRKESNDEVLKMVNGETNRANEVTDRYGHAKILGVYGKRL